MGKSAIERINSIGEPPAQKSFSGGGLSSYYLSSSTNTPNLRADEWGVAAAYGINVAVAAGMNVWETWLEGLKWEIREKNTDRVLVSSDMRDKPKGVGANFWQAVKAHREYTKHSFFRSIAFSDMLYGETYIHLVSNGLWGIGGLEWLNPLAVEPMIMRGKIESYDYSGDEGYLKIPPHCVAYRILRRNAFDDLRGQSKVLTAIMAVNLETNTKQGVLSYFKNAMMLGGIASPVSEDVNLSNTQIKEREAAWEQRYKGVGNAGRIMLAPTKLNLEFFPAPDIEKNYSVIQPLRNEILMAMDVPPQLANDPSQVTYDNADAVVRIWRDMHGIPYATDVESFINSDILPRLEPSKLCYFALDFSKFEVEKPEVVAADVSAGFIDLYEAAKLRGYTPDENLKGIYWPAQSQQPLHRDILVKLSRTLPSQVQLDLAQADKATSEAESIQSEPTPIVPMESLEAPAIVDNDFTKHIHEHIPSIKAFEPVQETMLDELEAWRKFALSGKKSRAFSPVWLLGDLSDSIQASIELIGFEDKPSITKVFADAKAIIETRIKAIQATRLDFEGDFDELLSRARRDKMGRVQWSSAMRSIIRRYGERAYIDGLNDGGVEDKPSDDDRITINELASSNSQYVTELGNVLYKGDSISDAQADIKAALWYNKTIAPFYQAGLLSADANGMYQWVLGNTEVHCNSCLRLQGQRHRLKKWKATIMPQSDDLDCGGWKCDCNLVKSRGQERGNF